jgi:spore coat-associated protein N
MTNPTAPVRTHRARKALIPLATLLAASALAVGSGATFTSTSASTVSLTSGKLEQTNDNAVIITADKIKPGFTQEGSVTITNSGDLPAEFALTEQATNGFYRDDLTMTITDATTSTTVFETGTFGTMDEAATLGEFAAGESRTYTFVVELGTEAGDDNQGKSASATYTWDAVQTDS